MNYKKHQDATLREYVQEIKILTKQKDKLVEKLQKSCEHKIVAEAPCCIKYSYQYPIRFCLNCGLEQTKDNCGRFGKNEELNNHKGTIIFKIERQELFNLRWEY